MARLSNVVLYLVIITIAAHAQYNPLTKPEKKQFVETAKALELAAEDKNYGGVIRFGDGILKRFESVLLDPSCRDLRPLYSDIESLVEKVKLLAGVDSIEQTIMIAMKKDDYTTALSNYDELFDHLNILADDSLIQFHKEYYAYCLRQFFNKTSDLQSIKMVSSLRNVDRSYVDSLKKNLELAYREQFVKISSSNDISALMNFKKQYPGLFENDVNNLIENYRAKWRLEINRSPSQSEIEKYHIYFPEPDVKIDMIYQKMLYKDFTRNMNKQSAMKYLSHFPDGRYTAEIRTMLDVQQEQQRLLSDRFPY